MRFTLFLLSVDGQRLRFSPMGELLSFASPPSLSENMPRHVLKSNQRKGDPTSLPCGFPIWRVRMGASPTRPGKAHKTCPAAELKHGSALFPSAHTKSAALKGDNPQSRQRVMPSFNQALASAGKPLVCRREAQPPEETRGWVSELHSKARFVCPARASSSPASGGEHRRGAEGRHTRGRLSLVTFFGGAKKVTRPKAKQNGRIPRTMPQASPLHRSARPT